jgi:hypothetical protein
MKRWNNTIRWMMAGGVVILVAVHLVLGINAPVCTGPPSITQQPTDQTQYLGTKNVHFEVTVPGDSLSYQWRKNGVNLSNGGNIEAATTRKLTIHNVTTADVGLYSARVTNPCGSVDSSAAWLTVVPPPSCTAPSISQQPVSHAVEMGESVSFKVTASGDSPLSYQWYSDLAGIISDDGGSIYGATTSELWVYNVIDDYAHDYWVRVSNSCGSVDSSQAWLTVVPMPRVFEVSCQSRCGNCGEIDLSGSEVGVDYGLVRLSPVFTRLVPLLHGDGQTLGFWLTEPGVYTIMARWQDPYCTDNYCGYRWVPMSGTVTHYDCGVASVTADQGVNIGGNTTVVCRASSGVVTVTATPYPPLAEKDLPADCWIFEGGVASNRLVHTVTKTEPSVTTFWARCFSWWTTLTLIIPKPEVTLTATCGTDFYALRWDVSGAFAPSLTTGFVIKRSTTPGGPYTVIGTAGSNDRYYVDTTVVPGTKYYYVVAIQSEICESQTSNEATSSTCAVFNNCSKPSYVTNYWIGGKDVPSIQRDNNCYNYANNVRTDTYAQPGRASGTWCSDWHTFEQCMVGTNIYQLAVNDGLVPSSRDAVCPDGMTKVFLCVATGYDFHWYRQNANGLWSQKFADDPVDDLWPYGVPITDPEIANRQGYTDFFGYLCTCSSWDEGQGHANIN